MNIWIILLICQQESDFQEGKRNWFYSIPTTYLALGLFLTAVLWDGLSFPTHPAPPPHFQMRKLRFSDFKEPSKGCIITNVVVSWTHSFFTSKPILGFLIQLCSVRHFYIIRMQNCWIFVLEGTLIYWFLCCMLPPCSI